MVTPTSLENLLEELRLPGTSTERFYAETSTVRGQIWEGDGVQFETWGSVCPHQLLGRGHEEWSE